MTLSNAISAGISRGNQCNVGLAILIPIPRNDLILAPVGWDGKTLCNQTCSRRQIERTGTAAAVRDQYVRFSVAVKISCYDLVASPVRNRIARDGRITGINKC